VASSLYSAYGYYVNGWCRGCGRKRNPDGSCANCDRWYNSPLISAGGPLLIATLALLAIGINALRPPVRTYPAAAVAPVLTSAAAPRGYGYAAAPRIGVPAGVPALPPLGLPAAPSLPGAAGYSHHYDARTAGDDARRLEQAQFLQLEQLRNAVAYADAVVKADDAARAAQAWQQQRSGVAVASVSGAAPAMAAPALRAAPRALGAAVQMEDAPGNLPADPDVL
jgi:hypothetical protein